MPDVDATAVSSFFNELAVKIEISRGIQRRLDVYLATGMNVVRDYICPDENGISDILRDLLDPNGPHGQGPVFLDIFLRQLDLSGMTIDAESATIREHYTSTRRRIDFLITFAGGKAVGIENKPFAEDQFKQLEC